MLPGFYLVGAVCIFATRRQQRLGDMVAGTLVVHSVPTETSILPAGTRTFTAASLEPPPQPVTEDDSGTTRRMGWPVYRARICN